MKLTIGVLAAMLPALQRLVQIKLPIKPAYRMAKNVRLISAELLEFEKEKQRLAQELGTSEDGQMYKFSPEASVSFNKAMEVLAAEEAEVALMTVTLEELGELSLEPAILADLELLILE